MENIYSTIFEVTEQKRPFVLATIISQEGSAPRGAGTKFLIFEDGSFAGTIGGGLLEAEVIEGARSVFGTGKPKRLSFILKGTDVEKTDMLCGGDAEIFLEPIDPENVNHLQIIKRIDEIERRGGSGVLVTAVNEKGTQAGDVPKMFIEPDGQSVGSLSGFEKLEKDVTEHVTILLRQGEPGFRLFKPEGGDDLELFLEPVMAESELYVFGAGHVSLQIVPLAHMVGFKVIVVDDRKEFADPVKFPDAFRIHEYPFENVLERLEVNEFSYIIIVTRGHIHDKTVLEQSLKSPAKYIGMIGSRRKREIIYKALLDEGFTQKDLDRVYSPIGLSIGAETPEEIAVSIIAELIKVRASLEDS